MKRKMLMAVFACVLVAAISNAALGAAHGFLRLGDIKGEAQDQDHKDWCIIESMGSRALATPTAAQGTGGPGQFSIKHLANISVSPAILRLMLTNRAFDMPLDVMEGGKLVRFMLYGCTISGYSLKRSGATAAKSAAHELEEIAFTYQRIELSK